MTATSIESKPLTVLRAMELHLLAETILLAYGEDVEACRVDEELQGTIAALYLVVAGYVRPAPGANPVELARELHAIQLNLDAIDLISVDHLCAGIA
jgi:hypothetical protein